MPLEWWLSLIFSTIAIAISPGNGAIISMRYGLKGGLKYASPVIIGLQLGLLSVYVIVLILLLFTNNISPHILDVISLIGGAYLIFLGGKDIIKAYNPAQESSKLIGDINSEDKSSLEPISKRILIGFFTNLTNPKGIIFLLAFCPQWLRPHAHWSITSQAVAMGIVMFIIDISVMHAYAYLASSIKKFLLNPRSLRMVELILGAILCFIGSTMAVIRFL